MKVLTHTVGVSLGYHYTCLWAHTSPMFAYTHTHTLHIGTYIHTYIHAHTHSHTQLHASHTLSLSLSLSLTHTHTHTHTTQLNTVLCVSSTSIYYETGYTTTLQLCNAVRYQVMVYSTDVCVPNLCVYMFCVCVCVPARVRQQCDVQGVAVAIAHAPANYHHKDLINPRNAGSLNRVV